MVQKSFVWCSKPRPTIVLLNFLFDSYESADYNLPIHLEILYFYFNICDSRKQSLYRIISL